MATNQKPGKPAKIEYEMVEMIATSEGYDNVRVRQPGDTFPMRRGTFGKWFEPVDPGEQEAYAALLKEDADRRAEALAKEQKRRDVVLALS